MKSRKDKHHHGTILTSSIGVLQIIDKEGQVEKKNERKRFYEPCWMLKRHRSSNVTMSALVDESLRLVTAVPRHFRQMLELDQQETQSHQRPQNEAVRQTHERQMQDVEQVVAPRPHCRARKSECMTCADTTFRKKKKL